MASIAFFFARIRRSFAAFYFLQDRLLAVDAVNRPQEFMAVRKALAEGRTADPAHLIDESIDIQQALSAQ